MGNIGAQAADLLDAALQGPVARAFRQGNYLIPITAQSTEYAPAQGIYAALKAQPDLSCDMIMGFPPADIPDVGPAIFAYSRTQSEADAAADAIGDMLAHAEPDFDDCLMTAPDAVAYAMAEPCGPVVIADVQDNPGAGGTMDTTGLIRALVDGEAEDAVLSMLLDA